MCCAAQRTLARRDKSGDWLLCMQSRRAVLSAQSAHKANRSPSEPAPVRRLFRGGSEVFDCLLVVLASVSLAAPPGPSFSLTKALASVSFGRASTRMSRRVSLCSGTAIAGAFQQYENRLECAEKGGWPAGRSCRHTLYPHQACTHYTLNFSLALRLSRQQRHAAQRAPIVGLNAQP